MTSIDSRLKSLLTVQGCFYQVLNLWALLATRNFLSMNNPTGDLFEARSFAALSLVLSIFFLVGATRKDLLRPAAFLGLGSAVALALTELFHVPGIGRTLLWFDLLAELAMAGTYITLFFFQKEAEEVAPMKETQPEEPKPFITEPAREVLDEPIEQESSLESTESHD